MDYKRDRLTNETAMNIIRGVMSRSKSVLVSDHAEERMDDRKISLDDAHRVLREGEVDGARDENGWRYSVKLDRKDLSCDHIIIVAIINIDTLIIVTVTRRDYQA